MFCYFLQTHPSTFRKIKLVSFLFATTGLLSACGKNGGLVSSVNVLLQEQAGEEWVGVNTVLNTGQASLPTMTIPIYDKQQQRVLIQIQLGNTGGKTPKSTIGFTTNLSRLDELPQCAESPSLLPNGSPVPIIDTTQKIYCVPMGQQAGRMYISAHAESQELVLGLALTVKEFQAIGKRMGRMDLFLPFEYENMSGVYGFFTSPEAHKNGLGLFFDLSRYLNQDPSSPSEPKILLTSKNIENTTPKEQNLLKGMIEIQSQKQTLRIP